MVPAAAFAMTLWAQAAAPAAPAPVAPAPVPIELRWEAPAGCPDLETARAGIMRGLPPTPTGMEPMQVDVVVSALDADHWRAALALRGPDWTATRTLKGATCAAVADAAGLVIGLALTNELQAREVVVAPPPPPPPPLSTPTLALALASDVGTLPGATTGGTLSLGWRWERARVDLAGSLFESRAGTVAAQPETGAKLSVAAVAARACYLRGAALALGPCLGAGVDRLRGQGTGSITVDEVTNFAPFLAGGLQGEWRLSRWVAPFVTVGATIPLVRARFSVKDIGQVHQAAAVSFRGAAGLELRFR
jgi:hypothetical protein